MTLIVALAIDGKKEHLEHEKKFFPDLSSFERSRETFSPISEREAIWDQEERAKNSSFIDSNIRHAVQV